MNEENCLTTFKKFLSEILRWEIKWGEVMRRSVEELFSEENNSLRKKEIERIFNKYLSKKAISAGQARFVNLSFEDPPEHDVTILSVEQCKEKYQIYVRKNIGGNEVRFDLIYENRKWRLDGKAFDFMEWKMQRTVF